MAIIAHDVQRLAHQYIDTLELSEPLSKVAHGVAHFTMWEGTARPSVEQIANYCKYSRVHTRRLLHQLHEMGILTIFFEQGFRCVRGATNKYIFAPFLQMLRAFRRKNSRNDSPLLSLVTIHALIFKKQKERVYKGIDREQRRRSIPIYKIFSKFLKDKSISHTNIMST